MLAAVRLRGFVSPAGLAIALLAATVVAPAQAATRHLPAEGGPLRRLAVAPYDILAVAYAGDTRLYANGGILMRIAPDGQPVRVARLGGGVNQIAASPQLVAVVVQGGTTLRLLAGPPTGPLRMLASCTGPSPDLPFVPFAVAGPLVAEALSCPAHGLPEGASAVRVHDGDSVRVEPAPPGRLVTALAGAPGVLATATQATGDDSGTARIEVRDTTSGALLHAVSTGPPDGLEPAFAVQSDGTLAYCVAGDRLAWSSPVEQAPHPLTGVQCLGTAELALAGGTLAYTSLRFPGLRVRDLSGGPSRTLLRGAPAGWPFAWNGRSLLVDASGCGDDLLGELAANAAPYRGPTCGVRFIGARREHGRRVVAVTIACPIGCRGDVFAYLGPVELLGQVHLRHHGRTTLHLTVPARGRRMLRRYRSLPFLTEISYVNPRTPGAKPILEFPGRLPGDGARRYVPPPPRPED
jgi:hypothetical protein